MKPDADRIDAEKVIIAIQTLVNKKIKWRDKWRIIWRLIKL